jgi:hypothetical protein
MTDEPVMITNTYGTKEWYQHNRLHRTDGPAVEYANGDKTWWQNDRRHRTDGPAVEYVGGTKAWYLHGTEYDPAGPPPVVLAVDTENTHYGLLRIGTRYLAGCRRFDTVESALAHWRPQDTPRARLFVAALEKELQFRSEP